MPPTPLSGRMSDVDRQLREHVATIPAPFRRAVLAVLEASDDYERAGTIGEYHQDPRTRNFAELLIDAEEDSSGHPTTSASSARASAIAMTASVHRDPWMLAKTTCPPTGTMAATCPPFAPPLGYSGNR